MNKTKNEELARAREVKKSLSTKKLKVSDFASLHHDIMELVSPLILDDMAAPMAQRYISAVEQLAATKAQIQRAATVSDKALKTLKALKAELAVFINVVKGASKSQSAAVQSLARDIYDEYIVALNGSRLNIINAKDIIGVFVAKLAKKDKTAIKSAGYEDFVNFITTKYQTYTTELTAAISSREKRATLRSQLIDQRDVVESVYAMLMMFLCAMEYSAGDAVYTTALNAIMLRVKGVKASHKATETRRENQRAADEAVNNDPKPADTTQKPDAEAVKPTAPADEKPAVEVSKPSATKQLVGDETPSGGSTGQPTGSNQPTGGALKS